jgi:hypothetical protein
MSNTVFSGGENRGEPPKFRAIPVTDREELLKLEKQLKESGMTRMQDKMEDALRSIDNWSRAYPLKVFPEPDFAKAAELLKAGGMTLDSISASNMRHVISTVGQIARNGLSE